MPMPVVAMFLYCSFLILLLHTKYIIWMSAIAMANVAACAIDTCEQMKSLTSLILVPAIISMMLGVTRVRYVVRQKRLKAESIGDSRRRNGIMTYVPTFPVRQMSRDSKYVATKYPHKIYMVYS